jgi:RND family efflux transporter MFP subunit
LDLGRGAIRRQVRTLFESGRLGALSDGQLLERFATGGGEAAERAFALLVERHGPMVLRVCRGVLGDADDAHDAFQATFLVLLRKSRGLWVRDSLGPWLHQVALRTASRARAGLARRRRHERRAAERAADATSPPTPPVERDWERILHEEIGRLPERQRRAVVLCDLEGRTHVQAARDLGWPVGTVKSRLARARERLRARLIRLGLAPAAAALALAASGRAEAALPEALARATIALATDLAAPGTVPAAVARLARGALSTMTLAKLRTVAASLVAVAALGAGLLAARSAAGPGPGPGPAAQEPKAEPARKAAAEMPVFVAEVGDIHADLIERGSLEASRSASLVNEVEGEPTIVGLVPEGTHVKKGDLVCELASDTLQDAQRAQEIAVRQAESELERARIARRLAEVARDEFGATILQQTQALEGEVARALKAVRTADKRVERIRRAAEQLEKSLGDPEAPSAAEILASLEIADRLDAADETLAAEELAMEQARRKLQDLKEFTSVRGAAEHQLQILDAKREEDAKAQVFEQASARLENINNQFQKLHLRAPADGIVFYANSRPDPPRRSLIEEGARVRNRQMIATIPDLTSLVVNAKVHESIVDQVRPGQRVEVLVDAFPGRTLRGEVQSVAPLPDPISNFAQARKVYTTRVRIDDSPPGLRPGMTAQVTIHAGERGDAVLIPLEAVVPGKASARFGGEPRVAVKGADGAFAWRVVRLGLSDGTRVEVVEGLEPGDQVAADPKALTPGSEGSEPSPPR